jgi:hypothetical protein
VQIGKKLLNKYTNTKFLDDKYLTICRFSPDAIFGRRVILISRIDPKDGWITLIMYWSKAISLNLAEIGIGDII